jgi:hypothetical protein
VRIFYVNNVGNGYARTEEVAEGKTVSEFFRTQMPDASSADYTIRVNRNPVDGGHILRDGDRVTITPAKIAGAGR